MKSSPLDELIMEMETLGRLKAKDVWDVIQMYPENIREVAQVVSCLPPTQVSVERLFSALRFLVSDLRSSMAEDLVDSILFLRTNCD